VHGSTMPQHVGYIARLVRGYDEAISYFVEKLGFTVAEDTDLGGGKRWVLVAPPGQSRLGLCWQRPHLRTNWLASGIRPVAASCGDQRTTRRLSAPCRPPPKSHAAAVVDVSCLEAA